MDHKKLDDILKNMAVPKPDENRKKEALNLAGLAFADHQKEKQKKSQGFGILSRLMAKTTQNRRESMETKSRKKIMYGGMATALALVLMVGVSYTQLENYGSKDSAMAELAAAPESVEATPQYIRAIEEVNERTVESAEIKGLSALPVPLEQPIGRLTMSKEELGAAAPRAFAREVAPAPQLASKLMGRDMNENFVAEDRLTPMPTYYEVQSRDKFEEFTVNPVKLAAEEPVSTFSVDVDTASYSFVRRQLNHGQMPSADAVRIEELINYFDYDYPLPEDKAQPFKPSVTVTDSPWAKGKKLVQIGIKGYDVPADVKPKSNLVFLLDVSGSMNNPEKLPLLKSSMKMLLETLGPDDTISLVTYASGTGVALEPTKVSDKQTIFNAIDNLRAGGGTAGAAGIELAYDLAQKNFDEDAVNRVILATDGDFNVGINDPEALEEYIDKKRESGVFLSVLGFGQGNYNDHIMQSLAQNGNGVAAYIDSLSEARKVLVDEASSTLFPIAKDVKIQVEFNPAKVAEYRLVGYETRALNREDFNNDKVDAGDIGAGHTVTAIYEITPVGSEAVSIDPLRYGADNAGENAGVPQGRSQETEEYGFLKMRYKLPNENASKLITTPISIHDEAGDTISADVRFATAVAAFGQLLKGGAYTGEFTYDDVIALAQDAKGADPYGYRTEFINLVRLAKSADQMQ